MPDRPELECMVHRHGMERAMQIAVDIIIEHGWMVQMVGASPSSPMYFYSIGMCRLAFPEIMVVGNFTPNVIMGLINDVGRMMKDGKTISDWDRSDEVLAEHPVIFREIDPASIKDHCVMLWNIFGDTVPVISTDTVVPVESVRMLQMALPDKHGKFPWEADCKLKVQNELNLRYVTLARD